MESLKTEYDIVYDEPYGIWSLVKGKGKGFSSLPENWICSGSKEHCEEQLEKLKKKE